MKLAQYYLPGIYVEDHSFEVPLDWRLYDMDPGRYIEEQKSSSASPFVRGTVASSISGKLQIFYRVLCAPEYVGKDLPLLVYLQGGPGGAGPRPLNSQVGGWISEALKHFRIILPDQRGTGRSSQINRHLIDEVGLASGDPLGTATATRLQADYLKRFLAPSIICDFEYLRRSELKDAPWMTLGQSYGGFLTLCYLSKFPQGLLASITAGGIPHVPASAAEVYAYTFPRMQTKTLQFYERYPEDRNRLSYLAKLLGSRAQHAAGTVKKIYRFPNGRAATAEHLQFAAGLGMKPGPERLHVMLDGAFGPGDGSLGALKNHKTSDQQVITDAFLEQLYLKVSSAANPLYWTLQEFIYADGKTEPIRWAAQREYDARPSFAADSDPLMMCGEAALRWLFEEDPALMPFLPAVDLLMEDSEFDQVYDLDQLAHNEVPLQAAVYFDDLYVDSRLQLDTLSRIAKSHAWVTNEFEHDGIGGSKVFRHCLEELANRGDLESFYSF